MFAIRKLECMKTILIPTDFSEQSLQLIKNAVLHYPNESISLVLAAGYTMSLNTYSFSNSSLQKLIKTLTNKSFDKTLSNLIQEHKNIISKVKIDLYTGHTNKAFIDFVTSNNIDESIIPNTNLNQFPNKKSYDLTQLIENFAPKVAHVAYPSAALKEETGFWFFNLKKQFSF